MENCYYTTNLQYITQHNSIIFLINSVIQDTQQIMAGQFDLSGTCPNDTETLPNLTTDFSVITFVRREEYDKGEGYPIVRKGCAGVRQQELASGQYPTVSVRVSSSPVFC